VAAEKPGSYSLNRKYERWWKEWRVSEEGLRLRRNGFAVPLMYIFYARYRDWYPHIDKTFGVWGRKQGNAR